MSGSLTILRATAGVTIQDMGREGYLSQGLSRGGAVDTLALIEGAALLEQDQTCAALELANAALSVKADSDVRIALTGAELRATLDGAPLVWNASHLLSAGQQLDLTPMKGGYGYLHLGAGVESETFLGSRSAHLACKLGEQLREGEVLSLGADDQQRTGLKLTQSDPAPRTVIRLMHSLQTDHFEQSVRDRFEATAFTKDARGNRMGQKLVQDGPGFATDSGLKILSETIIPGDIQITGDGTPFVLLSECQTTGGYPRIGTVLPCDLPHLVRAPIGAGLRFEFVSLGQAVEAEKQEAARRARLRSTLQPLLRDPHQIHDLLSYQLIGGVTLGDDLDRTEP